MASRSSTAPSHRSRRPKSSKSDARRAPPAALPVPSRRSSAASSALFLLGDIASDDRAEAQARSYFRQLASRYPTSRFAPTAAFRAAMIALLAGDARAAATEFDALQERYPAGDEADASDYWG